CERRPRPTGRGLFARPVHSAGSLRESWKGRHLLDGRRCEMAASGSGPSAGEGFPAAARLAGFVRRTLVATLGGFFFVALLVRGDGLPTGQGAGRHPLGEALDAAGAAILATEVVAWAEV